MSFKDMCTETVDIENRWGEKVGTFKCTLSQNKVCIFEEYIEVEEGYVVSQHLPGGKRARYLVQQTHFQNEIEGMESHWTIDIVKENSLHKKEQAAFSQVNNFHGSSNIQIGNENVMQITDAFKTLIDQIDNSTFTVEEKRQARGAIRDLISNPVVAAVAGSAVSAIAEILVS